MNFNKDYYAILGVLPTAEKAVIKAAYRALAQIYHPDRYEGSKEDAEFRMRELNEAYSVLSKPEKRAKYDEARGTTTQNADSVFDDEDVKPSPENDPQEQKWAMIEEYYPDLGELVKELNIFSWKLGYSYKAYMLETKEFKHRHEIARVIEREFLKTYYGNNQNILDYAKRLIRNRNREVALKLNQAVKLFGDEVDADVIIDKLEQEFDPFGKVKARKAEMASRDFVFRQTKNGDANYYRTRERVSTGNSKLPCSALWRS